MARSFYRPKPENMNEGTYYHEPSDIYYEMVRRDGHYFQRQYQKGFEGKQANLRETEIDFILGSGNHVRSYLHRTAKNTLILLPLAWYAENGGHFGMNPGYDRPDHQALRRNIAYDCMFCHNAYPEIPAESHQPVFSFVPEGIDCQRCHGNGDRHLSLASKGAKPEHVRAAIVNPARLTTERQMEVCMQCHLETTSSSLPASIVRYERGPFSYRPGEPLGDFMLHFDHAPGQGHDDKFEITGSVYRLRKSQCYQKSSGALKCTTCHDPHDTKRGEYTQACLKCHGQSLGRLVNEGRHTASADCIGCHMPKRRTDDVVHAVMTDHFIQRTKPADLLAEKTEQSQTEATAYRGEVVLYYPPTLPKPEDELYLAIAQVAQSSNVVTGIARLRAAIKKFRPANAEYYLQLGDAWCNTGKCDQALPAYEEALRHAPKSESALVRMASALTSLSQYPRGETTLQQALKLKPDDAPAWVQLGLAQLGQGKTSDAIAAFEKAKQADPDMVEAYNLIGAIQFESGDAVRAEAILRDGIHVEPNFAPLHNNLGNLLSETGRFDEAKFHFEAALRYKDDYPGARYNYALALKRVGRLDDAQTQVEAILRANPNSAEAHEFLGNLFNAKGEPDRAIDHYREAIRIAPDFDRANLDLGSALAAKGDASAALPYLRKAAQSKDAQTRAAALKILNKP
jgi:tetratricopeptide (TPR) repeat protein